MNPLFCDQLDPHTRIPAYNGTSPIGTQAQVARARDPQQTLLQLHNALDEYEQTVDEPRLEGCQCRIACNGSIDVRECLILHMVHPLPPLDRWYDDTTSAIKTFGYTIFWSGWARPSVVKLLGRDPTPSQIRLLYARSHRAARHNFRFRAIQIEDQLDFPRVHIVSVKKGLKPSALLASLPDVTRFASHQHTGEHS